jgi:hypothetical protein
MVIWAILAMSFIGGIAVLFKGDLKISKRRHVVGRTAKLLGVSMIGVPFVILATTYLSAYVSRALGSDEETSLTHGMMSGVLLLSALALILGMNLKRLSVPIQLNAPRPSFSGLAARSGEPDFSSLKVSQDVNETTPGK